MLDLARHGDLTAFNALVLEHQGLVFNLCLRMLGDRQAAEDATQDAFISAWRSLASMREARLRPWLLRIAANACTDELRRRSRRGRVSLDAALEEGVPEPPDPGPAPEIQALGAELRGRIDAALMQLSEEQRLVVILCDVQGLDYLEAAATMKTSLGTVKSRLSRARARLRDLLLREPELLPEAYRPKLEEAR